MSHLIGIAGASCAGKSELAWALTSRLPGPVPVVPLDAYYRDLSAVPAEERPRQNFDHPDALDRDLIAAHLAQLARGGAVERPIYDFATHTRRAGTVSIPAASYVIVEGLFTLYWEEVRPLLTTTIFIVADEATCLTRRLARDTHERGRTPDSVLVQWRETVRPMYDRYVVPTRRFARLVLDGAQPIERSAAIVAAYIRDEAGAPR